MVDENKKDLLKWVIGVGLTVLATVFIAVNTVSYINSFSLRTDLEVMKVEYTLSSRQTVESIKELKEMIKDIGAQYGDRQNEYRDLSKKVDSILFTLEKDK